jgi:HKD family nuclease
MKALVYADDLLAQFRGELDRASKFHLAFALVSRDGLQLIHQNLVGCLERGGEGRVLVGIDMPTPPDAIQMLCDLQSEFPTLEVRVFESGQRAIFHPKLAVFLRKGGGVTAIVGSGNLTGGGLQDNYEAGVFLDHAPTARAFLDCFDEHFEGGHSKRITPSWMSAYQSVWLLRREAAAAMKKIRARAIRIRRREPGERIPARIRQHTFAFTGGLRGDWYRQRKLYPCILGHGGHVIDSVDSMGRADCLVHADSLGGSRTTRKLAAARERGIPVISEDQFFRILAKEERLSRRRGSRR